MNHVTSPLQEMREEARRALTTHLVDAAITSRRCVRAFLPTPISKELVLEILEVASRAPSGANTQPWQVHVVTGNARTELVTAVQQAFDDAEVAAGQTEERPYYPGRWVSPYIDRRRKVGYDLYALLGIEKGDVPRMRAQDRRNFQFFDAPVGLLFTIDRVMGEGSLLDYGMFLENLMVAARARGLDTCPQASFNKFHRVVAKVLGFKESERLVCAMSLGYADPGRPENGLATEREPAGRFAVFHP